MAQSGNSSHSTERSNRPPVPPRRFWTHQEEETLIHALKNLRAGGWQCDGSFRGGYMVRPIRMPQSSEGSCIYGTIVGWKYLEMIELLGSLRLVQRMLYKNFCMVHKTMERMLLRVEITITDIRLGHHGYSLGSNVDFDAVSVTPLSIGGSKKSASSSSKRKRVDRSVDEFEKIVGSLLEDTKTTLGRIAEKLHHPQPQGPDLESSMRTSLFEALQEIPGLTLEQQVKATHHLAHNKADMDAL